MFKLIAAVDRALGRPEIRLRIKELFGGSGPRRLSAFPLYLL
jgi:hypothetical protein